MSSIVLPNGQSAEKPPKNAMIVLEQADGEKMAYPCVALSMISPEVLEVIAEAVYRKLVPQGESPSNTTSQPVLSLVPSPTPSQSTKPE